MKPLLNTLFVLSEDNYLSLDGENIVVSCEDEIRARFPLHTLEQILYFGYKGASPSLMGACAERGVSLCFFKPNGRFLARVGSDGRGNVLLRQTQFRIAEEQKESCTVARNFIFGKLYNARWVLERTTRDHPQRIDIEKVKTASSSIKAMLADCLTTTDMDTLRGVEGAASKQYFAVFEDLILQNRETFVFRSRSRRPPLDPVNAMLSFAYALLTNECTSALEGVGLDPYVGFLHRPRPGRPSLALDLMEELRPIFADRFVLSAINKRVMQPQHFVEKENRAVLITEEGRKSFLTAYQKHKQETITHPFLKEKIAWGLVPHVQALLLARYLRGDLDTYPPFLWK